MLQNLHIMKVKDPSLFKEGSFRTKGLKEGVGLILGKLKDGDGGMVSQAYRFSSDKFTADEVKKWCKEHEVSGKLEAAEKKEEEDKVCKGDHKGPCPLEKETRGAYMTRCMGQLIKDHGLEQNDARVEAEKLWKDHYINKSLPWDWSFSEIQQAIRDALKKLFPETISTASPAQPTYQYSSVNEVYLDGTCIVYVSSNNGAKYYSYDYTFNEEDECVLSNQAEVEMVTDWVEKDLGGPEDVCKSSVILKVDDDLGLIYGVVLEPEVYDAQGDIISKDEILKSAHSFMEGYLAQECKMGEMHKKEAKDIHVVESFTMDKELFKKIPDGAWVVVSKAKDPKNSAIWKKVKSGEYTGYSIGGKGKRDPVVEQ